LKTLQAPHLEQVSCALCGSKDSSLLFQVVDRALGVPGVFGVVQCMTCGLVYTSPRPIREDLGKCYPSESYFGLDGTRNIAPEEVPGLLSVGKQRGERLKSLLLESGYSYPLQVKSHFKSVLNFTSGLWTRFATLHPRFRIPSFTEQGRLLEIGIGCGQDLLRFAVLGWHVIGSDLSPDTCRFVRANLSLDTFQAEADQLGIPEHTFDALYLHHVFEHLPDPRRALAEFVRVLKPNGQLVMEVPNFDCAQSRRYRKDWRALEVPRHLYHYTPKTITSFLKQAGLKDVQVMPVIASPVNVFCANIPPTVASDQQHQNVWWRSFLITFPLYFVGPVFGLGDSIFVTARS